MNFLVLFLGILSSGTLIVSALSVHRLRLLMFSAITGVLVAAQYGLVGAWTGLLTCAVGLTWTALVAASYRYPKVAHPALLPLFALGHVLVFANFTDFGNFTLVALVPLIGGLLGLVAVMFKEIIYTKAIFIVCGAGWLGYEFTNAVYGQMVGESLNLIGNTVALCALIAAKAKGIHRTDMENLDTQLIEALTGAIHLPQQYHGVVDANRYPQHTQSGRRKPIKGAHASSVGYARLNAEYERTREQMRSEMVERFAKVDEAERAGASSKR